MSNETEKGPLGKVESPSSVIVAGNTGRKLSRGEEALAAKERIERKIVSDAIAMMTNEGLSVGEVLQRIRERNGNFWVPIVRIAITSPGQK